ncbi:hypothetical protein BpHYR1_022030, partial [Brachionus plicatilis]
IVKNIMKYIYFYKDLDEISLLECKIIEILLLLFLFPKYLLNFFLRIFNRLFNLITVKNI